MDFSKIIFWGTRILTDGKSKIIQVDLDLDLD